MSLRIIDANLNRAREGLRTAEEYARLVLNDATAAQALKDVRRGLEECASAFGDALLAARDVQGDPGLDPLAKRSRESESGIAAAALKRTQEALRVIEEYAQLHRPAASAAAARARYGAYKAEQDLFVAAPRRRLLRESPVMAIFSNASLREDWREVLASLLGAGCRLFQLREKTGSARNFADFGRAFLDMAGESLTIVNDRPDIASAIGAAGVHIGQEDLPLPQTRAIMGPAAIVGLSTHSVAEAKDAEQAGADYVGLGAMFHTDTKKVQFTAGPEMIPRVQLAIPVFCIGGITRANVAELAGHGARHIAVSSALLSASDPAVEYKALVQALGDRA